MATAISRLLEEMPESLTACEVCKEDFQSPQRLPRVLPCHHAFCGECLQGLNKDSHIDCPLCRRSFVVEGPFPVDITRMTLLDLRKITGDQEVQECEGCPKKVMVTARCLECEESLCEVCCQAHKVVKATRNHNLVSLAEAAIDPSKLLQLTEKCGKHEEKKLEFYCTECRQPACTSCTVLSHTGHNVVDLEAVLEEKRHGLQAECQRLEKAIPHFEKRVASSAASLENIDVQQSKITAKVEKFFTNTRNLLKERQEQILTDLETMVEEDRLPLEDQQASDQSLLSEAQASLEFGERMACLGLPSQLLSAPEVMARTSDELRERGTTLAVSLPHYEVDSSRLSELSAVVKVAGDVKSNPEWFFGTITREEAVEKLEAPGLEIGTFLLRESLSDPGRYALSVRGCVKNKTKVLHFKIIAMDDGRCCLSRQKTFDTLFELIAHHSQYSEGPCPRLKKPCPKPKAEDWDLSEETQDLELERNDLILEKKLAEDPWGEMWKGKLKTTEDVIIQLRKSGSTSMESFGEEVGILKSCHYKHVASLLGVCSGDDAKYLIKEASAKGILHECLVETAGRTASVDDLISMAHQIASAMDYLGKKRIVHRILGARNVLLGDDNLVKITNFRLARTIPEGRDEYHAPSGEKIMIKWTAPEALLLHKFTIKSDVWSFGAFLYELMSRGKIPFYGMARGKMLKEVECGYRMAQPQECPAPVYDIMLKCMELDPRDRVNFDFLCEFFSRELALHK